MQNLDKFLESINDDIVTTDDIEKFLLFVTDFVKKSKDNFDLISKENIEILKKSIEYMEKEHDSIISNVSLETNKSKKEFEKEIEEVKLKFNTEMTKVKELVNGLKTIEVKEIDEEKLVKDVLSQIQLPEYKEIALDTAEQIANKLESLKDDNRLDASAIKNLPEFIENRPNGGGWRNFFQMHDVNINNPTNGQVPVYDSTTKQWENGTVGVGGLVTVTTNSNTVKYLNPVFGGITGGNVAISANNVYMTPFLVQDDLTILGLAHNVSGTSTLSMGIYSGNIGELGTINLVTNSGVSVATSGTFATYNVSYGTPITLTPGLYWLAFATTAIVNTQTYPNGTAWNPLIATSDALSGYQYMFRASVASSGTALPSSIATSVNWTAQSRSNAPMNCRGILA